MDEGEDPGAGLGSLRPKGGGTTPDDEKAFLHRILGKPIVTHHGLSARPFKGGARSPPAHTRSSSS